MRHTSGAAVQDRPVSHVVSCGLHLSFWFVGLLQRTHCVRRRVFMSSQTARMTMTPVTSGCQLALTDSKFMPFSTSVRIKAPTKVPNTVPPPPTSDLPPLRPPP